MVGSIIATDPILNAVFSIGYSKTEIINLEILQDRRKLIPGLKNLGEL